MHDDMIEISTSEYEDLKNKVSEHFELLEQLVSIYENLSVNLIELGEVELEEALEHASQMYEVS
jgi:hypothetical protein